MGRTLETFRQAAVQPPRGTPFAEDARQTPAEEPAQNPNEVLSEALVEEEIPFIEVGPRKSFEASPAVLAAIPAPRSQGGAIAGIPSPSVSPPPALSSRPHHVLFRAVSAPSRLAPELVAFHAPDQPSSADYVQLLEALSGASKRSPAALLLAGVRPRIGTTTVLLNVAITAARQGRRVAVVDANLVRPAVAKYLGLEPAPGLTEVLAGDQPVEQALRATEQSNLVALTAGSPTPTLASTEALRDLLHDLREQFDLVLVDGPRWDGRPAGIALASLCDRMFLVVPGSEADKPPASELVRTLPEQGVCLGGVVLTGA
jgi:Mrp family chromosome partitioning ATPase